MDHCYKCIRVHTFVKHVSIRHYLETWPYNDKLRYALLCLASCFAAKCD